MTLPGLILCVSARTLRRRRHELGMLVEGRQFSELTDTQLDDLIRQALQVTSCRSEDGTKIPKTAWPRCSKNSRSACLTKGGSSHFCTEECSENYSKSLQCSLSHVVSTKEACRATL